MKKHMIIIGICLCAIALPAQEAHLMRFPHSVGDKVVFSHGGDIYTVTLPGGIARKLTSHVGYEMFPRFSPDGKQIAFTGQYDGNTEVYIIPSEGGEPRRLTYTATLKRDDPSDRMGPNNIVIGWTPDGKQVLFRSRCHTFNDFTGQLFTVPAVGGLPVEVPLKNGGFASFSPDGKRLAYNSVFREFRTWKRYMGGMADDIRVVDLSTGISEKIAAGPHQEIIPMWGRGEEIFFLSDRDNVMNLYAHDLSTGQTRQITRNTDYDIKFPAIGESGIVYEQGGEIYRYDLAAGSIAKIPVIIANDHPFARPEWRDVREEITDRVASPDGNRVLVAARGDIFSLPAKEGITYNLTNSSDANDRDPAWSPDGKYITYITYKRGLCTIRLREVATGEERDLTPGNESYIFNYRWSPDSRRVAWSDKRHTLNILDIKSGKNEVIEQSPVGPLNAFDWSPDSKLIVYARRQKTMDDIVIRDIDAKKTHLITDGWYAVSSPAFSDDGRYLLFTSARTFSPQYGRTEWNHVYTRMNKIYLLPLTRQAPVPFAPRNDGKSAPEEKKGDAPRDFTDLHRRVIEIPVIASENYSNLHLIGQKLYYDRAGATMFYDLEAKQETETKGRLLFSAGYPRGLAISGAAFQVVEMPATTAAVTKAVPLDGLTRWVDYTEEWYQIYDESWWQMREFFYAKNMHGVDWPAIREKYDHIARNLAHRVDLTYLIGEMIAELNVGHAYSQNGDHPRAPRIPTGLLGAGVEKHPSGYFRVTEVIEGANWSPSTRSPLTMPGVDVKAGDYILAVDGRSLLDVDNIHATLLGKAGKTVELTVNTTPSLSGARDVLVTPLHDEAELRYYRWVQDNIRRVSEATGGRVGYIHIPDMGVPGLNEFAKHYYPQLNKQALIIDDRGNGGGNVSPMIAERLQRTPDFYTMHTNQEEGSVSPVGTFVGPKVLLVNEYSASDGDLFPYRFRHNHLGAIIGRRTWGGVVGYSGSIRVVDGGSIVTPSYAPFAADGSGFIIEGEGVAPDIEVENDPFREYLGEDSQLEKAIEVILQQLESDTRPAPPIPPFPDKSAGKTSGTPAAKR
ncbi:MAG: PDZ domain-containing protein [Odoribacteraceae bacterium]|jgi:tricorn protease|nr:PDZ domain-containing protein [Odoribacteraceae bacterium]